MTPRTVASAARVTEGNSVASDYLPLIGRTPPQKSQVTPGNAVGGLDLCDLLTAAIDATGSRKEAATDMKLSEPVLSKQLGQVDGASPALRRLGGLKTATLVDFAERIIQACGAGDPSVARRQAAEDAVRAIGKLIALAV